MKNIGILTKIIIISLLLWNCDGIPPVHRYIVTYNGNGHTGGAVPIDDNRYETGETVTVIPPTDLEKDGSIFLCWNSRIDGNGYDYGASFVMGSSNVILYAKWYTLYSIGDSGPAGGWIFYDKGYYSEGWRYLEAAPGDQSQGIDWEPNTYDDYIDTIYISYGGGELNTELIVNAIGDGYYAAKLCDDLLIAGYDDWYLPNRIELREMYTNLKLNGIGGFTDYDYWTSEESGTSSAWYLGMDNGFMTTSHEISNLYVRAARSF